MVVRFTNIVVSSIVVLQEPRNCHYIDRSGAVHLKIQVHSTRGLSFTGPFYLEITVYSVYTDPAVDPGRENPPALVVSGAPPAKRSNLTYLSCESATQARGCYESDHSRCIMRYITIMIRFLVSFSLCNRHRSRPVAEGIR